MPRLRPFRLRLQHGTPRCGAAARVKIVTPTRQLTIFGGTRRNRFSLDVNLDPDLRPVNDFINTLRGADPTPVQITARPLGRKTQPENWRPTFAGTFHLSNAHTVRFTGTKRKANLTYSPREFKFAQGARPAGDFLTLSFDLALTR